MVGAAPGVGATVLVPVPDGVPGRHDLPTGDLQGRFFWELFARSGRRTRIFMDQFSSARLSESATPLPPAERMGSGTSGTRRIVAMAPGRRSEPQASSRVAPRWRL